MNTTTETTPAGRLQVRDLQELPGVLTVEQTAEFMQVSKQSAYDLIRRGELVAVKVGTTYRIPRRNLARFLGVDDADLASQQQARREEIETLLAQYRVAYDQVSRISARLMELGVVVTLPAA